MSFQGGLPAAAQGSLLAGSFQLCTAAPACHIQPISQSSVNSQATHGRQSVTDTQPNSGNQSMPGTQSHPSTQSASGCSLMQLGTGTNGLAHQWHWIPSSMQCTSSPAQTRPTVTEPGASSSQSKSALAGSHTTSYHQPKAGLPITSNPVSMNVQAGTVSVRQHDQLLSKDTQNGGTAPVQPGMVQMACIAVRKVEAGAASSTSFGANRRTGMLPVKMSVHSLNA